MAQYLTMADSATPCTTTGNAQDVFIKGGSITLTSLPLAIAKETFMVSSAPFTPGVTPQDFYTLTGGATKVLRVVAAWLSAVQTTAGFNSFYLLTRRTANSGGTSASNTVVPIDSAAAPVAEGTVLQYTLNPTAGALNGNIWSGKVGTPAPAGTAPGFSGIMLNFLEMARGDYGKVPVLRGTGELIAWNFNGAALPAGLSLNCGFMWTEE